jgi:hypothetical protein
MEEKIEIDFEENSFGGRGRVSSVSGCGIEAKRREGRPHSVWRLLDKLSKYLKP